MTATCDGSRENTEERMTGSCSTVSRPTKVAARIPALMTLLLMVPSQERNPDSILQRMQAHREERIQRAGEQGELLNYGELNEELKAMASEAIKQVIPAEVEPREGLAWVRLFRVAEHPQGIPELCERFLTSDPSPEDSFEAQLYSLRANGELAQIAEVIRLSRQLNPRDEKQAISLVMEASSAIRDVAPFASDSGPLLETLDYLKTKIPASSSDPSLSISAAYYRARSMVIKAEVLKGAGERVEAVAVLDRELQDDSWPANIARYLSAQRVLIQLVGQPAPSLETTVARNGFHPIRELRGKVVVLDFFAHWCGPCLAVLPELSDLVSSLGPQGLAVISVTKLYGYFGSQQGLGAEAELKRMGDFLQTNRISWPVACVEDEVFEHYGVSGLPHMVLIDRTGVVRSVKLGYSSSSFQSIREEIESLLKEPVPD